MRLANPDRVIKAVDGDYDPPGPGLPDNHCYCGWYNGHGVDIGKLHKGYWQRVKPGWHYGCGEFGAEGLDPVDVMRRHYPRAGCRRRRHEEARLDRPTASPSAQTGRFHYMWFDTQHTLDGLGRTPASAPGLGHAADDRGVPPRQPHELASPSTCSSTPCPPAG